MPPKYFQYLDAFTQEFLGRFCSCCGNALWKRAFTMVIRNWNLWLRIHRAWQLCTHVTYRNIDGTRTLWPTEGSKGAWNLVPLQSKLHHIIWNKRHYVIDINGFENGWVALHTGKFLIVQNVQGCLTSFGEKYASLLPCAAISLRVPYTASNNKISVSL